MESIAKQNKCHIITTPPSIIEKIDNFGKTFDQLTKETVKKYYEVILPEQKEREIEMLGIDGDIM